MASKINTHNLQLYYYNKNLIQKPYTKGLQLSPLWAMSNATSIDYNGALLKGL